MADLPGTPGNDVIQGTPEDDTITLGAGNDTASGEGADDLIDGGPGDDLIFGDAGVGTAPGQDASAITLDIGNAVSDSSTGNNNAGVGDTAIYRDVATLEDGTSIWGRLVLVSTTNDDLPIDLTGGDGFEILLNSGRGSRGRFAGEEATFRLEFFDPATGAPVSINSTATFNDLDRNSVGDQESVTLNAGNFTAFATSDDTSLAVTTGGGQVTAAGTEQNSPDDQDAWFSGQFENREFIEFTLETRSTQSGFTLSGDLIDDAVVTPIEAGNDTLIGGAGADTLLGQGSDDLIDGGTGNDSIDGGTGDDTLIGGDGNDSMSGGDGADLLVAGPGDDTLTGGLASDRFTVPGAGNHVIVGGEDTDGTDIDVLDLSGQRTNIIDTGPESGIVEFVDGDGNVTSTLTYSEIEEVIICFTPGTRIATRRGEVPVQQLKQDDRVFTRDNGVQPLAWVGRRNLNAADMIAHPEFQPVVIKAGALGNDLPQRDMLVSPNHRMLITSERSEVMFGEREVLVAAKHLTEMDGVERMEVGKVSYLHLMFERHEVILADGAWTESFQPGDHAMRGIHDDQRSEILSLFPELDGVGGLRNYAAARRLLRAHEAHLLALAK